MEKKIKPLKGVSSEITDHDEDMLIVVENELKSFFRILESRSDGAKDEISPKAFKSLMKYIRVYDRILYFVISDIIYADDEEDLGGNKIGTILTNLENLVKYASDEKTIADYVKAAKTEDEKKAVIDTKKAVWKIWDHVNLAHKQYLSLKQSDKEYDDKFKTRINEFKSTIVNEMNGQLLSMVGMFTALAFILFGGIDSMANIFSKMGTTSLLKLAIIGCIWGLCILNVVFVFLFCVGKMTNSLFKSTKRSDASFFQRYPVVCWTDFVLIVLITVFSWMYYSIQKGADLWIGRIIELDPTIVSVIGLVVIIVLVYLLAKRLIEKTRPLIGDEDTY